MGYEYSSNFTTAFKRRFGIEQATLITQRFHLPRAHFTCSALGIESQAVFAVAQGGIDPETDRPGRPGDIDPLGPVQQIEIGALDTAHIRRVKTPDIVHVLGIKRLPLRLQATKGQQQGQQPEEQDGRATADQQQVKRYGQKRGIPGP